MDKKKQIELSRRIVQEGMNRRRTERQMEEFEAKMIRFVNENAYTAELEKRISDAVRKERAIHKAQISERAKRKAAAKQRRKDTALGCLIFLIYANILSWLTTWTHLPVWAAALYIAFGALFLFLYVCMLYSHPNRTKKEVKTNHGRNQRNHRH